MTLALVRGSKYDRRAPIAAGRRAHDIGREEAIVESLAGWDEILDSARDILVLLTEARAECRRGAVPQIHVNALLGIVTQGIEDIAFRCLDVRRLSGVDEPA